MRGLAHGGPVASPLLATGLWALALTCVFGTLAVRASTRRR